MNTCFVDTNLFVRYLTDDDAEKSDRVEALLSKASEGKVQLVTSDLVLVELIWVLESSYKMKPGEITPMIRAIMATPGLQVINAELISRALDHYENMNVDIVDAHIAALMKKMNITDVFSFDRKHLSRISDLNRIEP